MRKMLSGCLYILMNVGGLQIAFKFWLQLYVTRETDLKLLRSNNEDQKLASDCFF